MKVEKVKYMLWAADWQRCLDFYRKLFGGVSGYESEVWSELNIAGATIGIHGGGQLASEPNDTPEDPLHLAMCIDTEGNEFMMTQKRH